MSAPTTDSAMYRTMHRQPADLQRLLDTGWDAASEAATRLASARRVFLVGMGTSHHASLVGSWLLRSVGIDARATLAFDFALYPESFPIEQGDAVIVMAHSGVKQFSMQAMMRASQAGATVLSVGSLTAEHPGSSLVLRTVEREQSAAFTASHLAAMTVLAQVAVRLGAERGSVIAKELHAALERLPDQVAELLDRENDILPIAQAAVNRRVYAAGAGPNEATALEAVIKVREAAQGWIDALAIEQFLHGPIVAVNAGDLAVIINASGPAVERVGQITQVLEAIGAELWLVGRPVAAIDDATVFSVPDAPEVLSPLLNVVPIQILAYHMATIKGINPDKFRRDEPIYGAAFGLLKL